ncbi:two component signal transduction system protein [Algimonas arctica]|uniref:Two component signal transduction system protein n=1 Tax=Algimonas arctica TaxID=1479486 RepID=A0A8J3CPS3_9PROT|nr:response regulator [Algimonas arctica]GHA83075.1 two component signal transduction system protein [Algimonas arctica]
MRVLLAENNLTNRLIAQLILERERHDVTLVTNGAEAVVKTQSMPYDVLLLDIVMPVMDGFQTVQYLQQHTSRPTHIFALSAYDTEKDIALYRASGFDGVIAKPLRPGDLSAALLVKKNHRRPSIIGIAANGQDAAARPLMDEAIIRDGPGQADDVTRERILRSYRSGLSTALKELSRALPGYLEQDMSSRKEFLNALHSLRSASLTVGMNRAPYLAKKLREAPKDQVIEGVARLLHAVRDSLPVLEAVLLDATNSSSCPSVTEFPSITSW